MADSDIPNDSSAENGDKPYGEEYQGGSTLDSGAPTVAAAKGKVFIVMGAIIAFILFIIYFIMGGGDEEEKIRAEMDLNKPKIIARAPSVAPPAPPPIQAPPPPRRIKRSFTPPPPPPPAPFRLDNSQQNAARQERIRSNMLISSGGRTSTSSSGGDQQQTADAFGSSNDANASFANGLAGATEAPTVKAGRIKDLSSTVGQGKIISAVLETAIDTQLPGMIRAIVSHDVYPEDGSNRIIPKGSRLVGVYNTSLFKGQDRVFVIWTRVIRPDGVDVMINSPGVDMLGRAGVEGFLDSRYSEMFSSAVLTSILGIGLAAASDELVGDSQTTQTSSPDGSNSTTSSATNQAATQALGNVAATGSAIIQDMFSLRSMVTVDQGTRINVMVNKDLIFPPEASSGTQFIR